MKKIIWLVLGLLLLVGCTPRTEYVVTEKVKEVKVPYKENLMTNEDVTKVDLVLGLEEKFVVSPDFIKVDGNFVTVFVVAKDKFDMTCGGTRIRWVVENGSIVDFDRVNGYEVLDEGLVTVTNIKAELKGVKTLKFMTKETLKSGLQVHYFKNQPLALTEIPIGTSWITVAPKGSGFIKVKAYALDKENYPRDHIAIKNVKNEYQDFIVKITPTKSIVGAGSKLMYTIKVKNNSKKIQKEKVELFVELPKEFTNPTGFGKPVPNRWTIKGLKVDKKIQKTIIFDVPKKAGKYKGRLILKGKLTESIIIPLEIIVE